MTTVTNTDHDAIAHNSADGLRAEVSAPAKAVEEYLGAYVRSLGLPDNLRLALEHALLAGGKRLRPILSVHCAAAVGGDPADSYPGAGAVEMIHAFSLVHDDLPALDNDELRRGQPTLHVAHGEAMAILAGDALMSLAFQLIAERAEGPGVAHALTREVAAGTTAMIAGQIYDTLGGFDDGLTDERRLELIHSNKTGALIRAACRCGAIAGTRGRVTQEALDAITAYAEAVGLMFQIVDDLLDVEQSSEHLGKRAAKDEEAGKLTYPGVVGVERSRDAVAQLLDTALGVIAPMGEAARPLRELAEYLAIRTR